MLPYSPVTVICAGHVDRRYQESGGKPRLPSSCLIETPNAELTMARQEKHVPQFECFQMFSIEFNRNVDKAFNVLTVDIDFCILISAR